VTFGDAVEELTTRTERRLVALFERFLAEEITAEVFRAQAVALVGVARARAIGLADVGLAAAVEAEYKRPTPVLGLTPPSDDAERLAKGITTLLEALADDGDVVARIARYGRSEPAEALQTAYVDGMRLRKIPGYSRGLNPGACQLCVWLRKEGYVYPAEANFHRHTGCTCYPIPAFRWGY